MRKMRERRTVVFMVALVLALPVASQAAVVYGRGALPGMIDRAVTIVVGTVTNVASDMPGHRVVAVHVIDTWKGTPTSELNYIIPDERFACDMSNGVVGEKVVLFLGKSWLQNHLAILSDGRGRMAIQGSDSDPVVVLTLPTPEGLIATPTNVDNGGIASGIRLSALKAYVGSVLNGPSGP